MSHPQVWEALGVTTQGQGDRDDVDRARVSVFSDCGRRIFVLGSSIGEFAAVGGELTAVGGANSRL
eukprot:1763525-Pyramimonas_sp.AAC.1